MQSPARRIAFDILRKVEGGGYASDLLVAKPPASIRATPGLLPRSSSVCCDTGSSSIT
jgi:hypothetical protein